jgi:hypothetical protein
MVEKREYIVVNEVNLTEGVVLEPGKKINVTESNIPGNLKISWKVSGAFLGRSEDVNAIRLQAAIDRGDLS